MKDRFETRSTGRERISRALIGGSLRGWLTAVTVNVVTALCTIFVASITHWTVSGLLWIVLLGWATIVTIAYSSIGGGLLDSWLLLVITTLIASVTLGSVTPTFEPYPIWRWSLDQDIVPHAAAAVQTTLIWGTALGTFGFTAGELFRWVESLGSDV